MRYSFIFQIFGLALFVSGSKLGPNLVDPGADVSALFASIEERLVTSQEPASKASSSQQALPAASIGGHRSRPDATTTTAAFMLIGSTTFVMSLFYMVQDPDLDVRYYSWGILTLAACIFIAILITDTTNSWVRQQCFSHADVGDLTYFWMCAILAMFWFIASQAVCAFFSGAFEQEQETQNDCLSLRQKGKGSSSDANSEENLWQRREMALKCWGGLVGHCAGFSIIAAFGALQDTKYFSSSPGMAICVVPIAFVLITGLFKIAAFVRYQMSLLGDGQVSKGEELWDECSAQAENSALCLGISFASMRSFCFCVLGAMPDMHGHVSAGSVSDVSWALGWKVLWVASLACMVLGLGVFKMRHKFHGMGRENVHGKPTHNGSAGEERHGVADHSSLQDFEDSDDTRTALVPRCLGILGESLIMCFSWGMLYSATAFLNTNLKMYRYQLTGHIVVALAVSALCCLVVVLLDRVADFLRTSNSSDEIVHIINHIIETHGLLVGISWEICYNVSMQVIGVNMNAMGENMAAVFGVCLCLVVVPAYRMYMLPELEKRRACLAGRLL